MMTRTLILALSLTTVAAPAVAAETETMTATVRTDDINLTRASGRDQLDLRIRNAVRRACQSGHRGAAESARQAACVASVMADADRQVAARSQGGTQLALLMVDAAR